MSDIDPTEAKPLYKKLLDEAQTGGYHLNPDAGFTMSLIEGLLVNQDRYGYLSCPCRLAAGDEEADSDIICPCDYRDQDLAEFGACYCALYVSDDVRRGVKIVEPIPERRSVRIQSVKQVAGQADQLKQLAYPVWRCKVCGYLCARSEPPEICPICKVKKERFEQFI